MHEQTLAESCVHHCTPAHMAALHWLPVQVKAKDVKLKQLRGAIRALEEKLAQLLKDKVDM